MCLAHFMCSGTVSPNHVASYAVLVDTGQHRIASTRGSRSEEEARAVGPEEESE